jgi:preprotein translocase subunit SecD
VCLTVASCAGAWAQDGKAPRVTLEVRLAVPCASAQAGKPVKDPDGVGSLCLDKTPFLTERDVESAEVHHNSAGHAVVFLTFHTDAARRELQVTLNNVGGRVAIVLNGNLVAAPRISSASRQLFIDGNFTQARAEALVESFNTQARR